MSHLKIIIFAGENEVFRQRRDSPEFAGIGKDRILWADSTKYSRQHFINTNLNEWLLFLDHDCCPGPDTFVAIERLLQSSENSSRTAFAGRYENPQAPSLLQRTHNFIANGWLEHSFLFGDGALLGGVFLIYSTMEIEQSPSVFWGAEDKALANQLKKQGFILTYQPQLKVVHDTSRSFMHFVRRAWLHGENEVRYVSRFGNRINVLYWIRKAAFSDLSLVPLVLLHFCIQKAALLFQTARPGNK